MDSSPSVSSGSSGSLQRGKACLSCRRRKMRCDGARPVCNQCAHANKQGDCVYVESQSRSRTQMLEENIAILQARIQELENPGNASVVSAPVTLLEPRTRSHHSQSSAGSVSVLSLNSQGLRRSVLSHSSGASDGSSARVGTSSAQSSLSGPEHMNELPPNVSRQLLDAFFEHSSQLGWFLNTARFRHALSLPEGNDGRPISALSATVYLVGAANMHRITGIDPPVDMSFYLSCALSNLGHALEGAPSHGVVQVIQTRVLLALYHYIIGKFVEGRHHSDAAASLVLSSGLHKIRSTQPLQNGSSFVEIVPLTLPAPLDQIEEGERINAMWMVFTICQCWGVAFGAPTLMSDNDALGTQIDTPWPLDMENYERGPVFQGLRTSRTLHNFLAGVNNSWPWENHCLLAQISGASALFDRATNIASCWRPDTPLTDTFYAAFTSVDDRIGNFQSQLYSLQKLADADSDVVRTMHVIHCVASAASIQLHSAFGHVNVESRTKCLLAAQAIVQANITVRVHEFLIINPALGIVWGAACQVLVRELVYMRSNPIDDTPPLPDREAEVRTALDQLQSVMTVFAPVYAFTKVQLEKVQQELLGLKSA